MPVGWVVTSILSNSIPRTERNSLVLRQLVQPGRQKTLIASLIAAPPHPVMRLIIGPSPAPGHGLDKPIAARAALS